MALNREYLVRQAVMDDWDQLSRILLDENGFAHRHLDWRTPLEWLGFPPYFVIEFNGQVESVLACPPDPPGIGWIRFFSGGKLIPHKQAWSLLWENVRCFFQRQKGITVCAITNQYWFREILESSNFQSHQQIVMLTWQGSVFPRSELLPGLNLRRMEKADIPNVVDVDRSAFDIIWQNSEQALQKALSLASVVTVAEMDGRIVGYQLSTTNLIGGHLARLAVFPEFQGRGIGRTMVADVIQQFSDRRIFTISVNTQSDNLASLSLYEKLGFRETGERFPVFEYQVL